MGRQIEQIARSIKKEAVGMHQDRWTPETRETRGSFWKLPHKLELIIYEVFITLKGYGPYVQEVTRSAFLPDHIRIRQRLARLEKFRSNKESLISGCDARRRTKPILARKVFIMKDPIGIVGYSPD